MLDSLIIFFKAYGYISVFGVLLLSGFGLPIPEDVTLVAGGFIASLACETKASFFPALKMCHEVHVMFFISMVGVLLGDGIMFTTGRFFGPRVCTIPIFSKVVTQKRYEWAQEKFEKYGTIFVFAARFMPGLRSPIFVVTGATHKVSYLKFLLTDGTAALVSVPIWIYLGFWAERQLSDMQTLEHYIKRGQMSILFIVGLLILGTFSFLFIRRKIKQKYNFFK